MSAGSIIKPFLTSDGHAVVPQPGHRVREHPGAERGGVVADLEVQVRTGGVAGRADGSDGLPSGDALAHGNSRGAEVCVQREHTAPVVDGDVVAVRLASVAVDGDN